MFSHSKKQKMRAISATISMSLKQRFDGNGLFVFGGHMAGIARFLLLAQIWKTMESANADFGGLTLPQLLTYSLMATFFKPQLDIWTPATEAIWEGSIINRYTRPMPISVTLIAATIGLRWIPGMLFLSFPLFCISIFSGISIEPATLIHGCYAGVSLALSIIIGFSLDLIFASLAISMKNASWAMIQIRQSVMLLMSGSLIPFSLMPQKIGLIFSLLPFGSVANAPLNIYIGFGEIDKLILLQIFWAITLPFAAFFIFRKSEENMISFGG
jgi:ABC-2 type transport system permease protein